MTQAIKDREEAATRIEAMCQEIARYIARHDCKNTDLTVNPIDLLRGVWEIFDYFEAEIERLDQKIEALENR